MKFQTFSQHIIPDTEVARASAGTCTACVIESNRLAAEYLAGILRQDPQIDVRFFDEFVDSGAQAQGAPLVFCLDHADAVLPLRASLKLLKLSYPDSRCLLLDRESSSDHLGLLLDTDIHGFLEHGNVKEWLLEAVRSISRGLLWIHPEFVHNFGPNHQSNLEAVRSESLTKREREVLNLVTHHCSNKEISMLLEIEESTVKFHLSNILAKRNVSRREDLVTSRISGGWKTLLQTKTGTTDPMLRSLLKQA
jgi:DNA-binding NarL/FixJ family response regulator